MKKLVIGLAFIAITGFGGFMYYAGQTQFFGVEAKSTISEEEEVPLKKPSVTKPKNAFSSFREQSEEETADYTFFKTLNDSRMGTFVDLNGNVVQSSFSDGSKLVKKKVALPVRPVEKKMKTLVTPPVVKKAPPVQEKPVKGKAVKEKPVKKETVQEALSSLLEETKQKPEKAKESFWVQVSSFKTEARAKVLVASLKKKGFDSFFKSAEIKDRGVWYRVYLGQFDDRDQAEQVVNSAKKQLFFNPVVVPAPTG